MELGVGDVLQIGDRVVTVVDISEDEVSFRIDPLDPLPIGFEDGGSEIECR